MPRVEINCEYRWDFCLITDGRHNKILLRPLKFKAVTLYYSHT